MSKDNLRRSLPVLLYHRIIRKNDPVGRHKIYVYESQFERQLKYLAEKGFTTKTFVDIQKENGFDNNSNQVILTFDDGYEDNYTVLFPLLKKYGMKAVIFLVTKQNHNAWGVKEGEPFLPMMNESQLKEMSDYGIEFGGHTKHHVDLAATDSETAFDEIEGCRNDIQKIVNKEIISFAYPFGSYNDSILNIMKKSGYIYAASTNTGPKLTGEDPYLIRRIEITPRTTLKSFANKVNGFYFRKTWFDNLFPSKQKA